MARVERSIFLGSHFESRLNIAGQRLTLRSMDGESVPTGTDVTITADPGLHPGFSPGIGSLLNLGLLNWMELRP